MKPSEVYALFTPPAGALGQRLSPAGQALLEEQGIPAPILYNLVIALDFDPEPMSADTYLKRTPYAARINFEEPLVKLAELGLMEPCGAGEYRITVKGHELLDQMLATYELLGSLMTLPAADLDRLMVLSLRLVEACLSAPEPAEKYILTHNRHSDPGPDASPLYRYLQYTADLGTFRDDCHLAAWQIHPVSGPAWEAFTFVWRNEAHTAAELVEKLPFRRVTVDEYAAALRDLEAKGWIKAGPDGGYQVTDTGAAIRQEAESATDRLFYAPWSALTPSEVDDLGDLLTRLAAVLEAVPQA